MRIIFFSSVRIPKIVSQEKKLLYQCTHNSSDVTSYGSDGVVVDTELSIPVLGSARSPQWAPR